MKTKTLPKAIMQAKAKLRGALLYAFLRDRKSGAGMNDAPFPLDYANRHAIDILKKAQDVDFVIDQLTQGGQSLTQVARSLTRTSPAITTCDQRSVVWLDGQAYAEFEMAGTNLKCFLKKPAEYRVALAVFQEADARNCDVITVDNGGDIYNRICRIVRTLNGAVILSKNADVTTDRLLTLFHRITSRPSHQTAGSRYANLMALSDAAPLRMRSGRTGRSLLMLSHSQM